MSRTPLKTSRNACSHCGASHPLTAPNHAVLCAPHRATPGGRVSHHSGHSIIHEPSQPLIIHLVCRRSAARRLQAVRVWPGPARPPRRPVTEPASRRATTRLRGGRDLATAYRASIMESRSQHSAAKLCRTPSIIAKIELADRRIDPCNCIASHTDAPPTAIAIAVVLRRLAGGCLIWFAFQLSACDLSDARAASMSLM